MLDVKLSKKSVDRENNEGSYKWIHSYEVELSQHDLPERVNNQTIYYYKKAFSNPATILKIKADNLDFYLSERLYHRMSKFTS